MYLATPSHTATATYQLRTSYQDDNGDFRHRLVFDLGTDPTVFIEPLGELAVFFNSQLEQAVEAAGTGDAGVLLERLLWSFLPAAVRNHLSRFHRGDRVVPGPVTDLQRQKIASQIHLFDRRRLYFLHYRAIDQSRLFTLRDTACRPLLDMSRDEREYLLTGWEQALEPGE